MENTELPLMYLVVHVAFRNILRKWQGLQVRGGNTKFFVLSWCP